MNYQGAASFKTLPGGCLSLGLTILILCYAILRYDSMYKTNEWSIAQQTTVASFEDVKSRKDFKDMKNITIAVQIAPKREKQENALLMALLAAAKDNGFAGFRRNLFHSEDEDPR
jgi:hypothetical protein